MINNTCCDKIKNEFKPLRQECFSNKTSAKENNRTFTIDKSKSPKEQFCRIEVDNCLIKDTKIRKCDYVFIRCLNNDHYFVELKGSDTEHALKQLENTIYYFKERTDLKKSAIFAYVVSSRVPSNSNQRFNILKKKFRAKLLAELQIGTNKLIKKL